ncbi:MAG: V-type ATP synthase subunit A, partial [Acidobacteria bacterium]|nr:V-type ATP synthase subunit A [Acidobacteriota bacterium]
MAHSTPGGVIARISGPLVVVEGLADVCMYGVVLVGKAGLVGEVIRLERRGATVQVYEDTEGLRIGEPVIATGSPFVVELGPGLLGSIFDGIQRPLSALLE